MVTKVVATKKIRSHGRYSFYVSVTQEVKDLKLTWGDRVKITVERVEE